ncbi:MAG: histidinol-phosphatase [Alphaproteobacteria bacterium]|nr:MAG: histidinol-phosphatase [Alphaproteobacteria bacterium]
MTAPVQGEWSELAGFACSLAGTAARSTSSYFRKPLDIIDKSDNSPVTIADRETERLLREMITKSYPAHGILGEEHGVEGLERDEIWVLDPIDGTKSFVSGLPLYGTLIAYVKEGRARIGAISMPAMKEFWIAIEGKGCYFNGTRCQVSKCTDLDQAILMTTSAEYFSPDHHSKFTKLRDTTRIRRYGGDCYIYAILASGWADIVVETGLQTYDYMALIPVIEEAGGVITDWSGNRLGLDSDGTILAAATPELHAKALEQLAG